MQMWERGGVGACRRSRSFQGQARVSVFSLEPPSANAFGTRLPV